MKPRLLPLYFEPGRDEDFDRMLAALTKTLADVADFLPPQPLGSNLKLADADAVVVPQLLGQAYRQSAAFKAIRLPILLLTTEFGTLSMWDWELATYLRTEGVQVIAPYTLAQARNVCAALAVKRELAQAKFLVFQDNPGQGFQAPIFKRFYWWEDECSSRMAEKFGVQVVRKSYRDLAQRAKAVPDSQADAVWKEWKDRLPAEGVSDRAVRSAVKLYIVLRQELDADSAVQAMGINCLNESHFSDTTPCLAWSMLYAERRLTWGCEADTLSMLTQHILHRSLGAATMMTNLYPFVLGNAALKHERIASFPAVEGDPDNYVLLVHCGYMGLMPAEFATQWTLRPKVLAIVDENATAVDALFPTGKITLAKLLPTMDRLSVAEGELARYAQFPGSDCLNGGVAKVRDGHKLMAGLVSHHYLLTAGHNLTDLRFVAKVFNLDIEEI
jgi:hypothetical protein